MAHGITDRSKAREQFKREFGQPTTQARKTQKLVKGSTEARRRMAKLRGMRGKK